jgi:hypothetical protein
MNYYGYYSNGVSVNTSNLNDLVQLPDLAYIVKEEIEGNKLPKYSIINPSGSIRFYRIGGFELRDIGYGFFYSVSKLSVVTVTICEIRLGLIFQVQLPYNGVASFHIAIFPFLNLLEEHGSYKSYQQSLELARLKEENEELKSQLQQLSSPSRIDN